MLATAVRGGAIKYGALGGERGDTGTEKRGAQVVTAEGIT